MPGVVERFLGVLVDGLGEGLCIGIEHEGLWLEGVDQLVGDDWVGCVGYYWCEVVAEFEVHFIELGGIACYVDDFCAGVY